jgi:hypothetical protein
MDKGDERRPFRSGLILGTHPCAADTGGVGKSMHQWPVRSSERTLLACVATRLSGAARATQLLGEHILVIL